MSNSSKSVFLWLSLTLISILGFFLVYYCTVWGGGLISDSFQYVASARSLAAGKTLGFPDGNGEIIPLTKYPPLFSIILAVFEMGNVDGLEAARILNAAIFAVNIGLVCITIKKISNSIGFSLFGALLTALSIVLIEIHSWVLSEPLYIFFSLLTFYWLAVYFETSKQRWLFASALTGTLALLTRYVGLALLPVALIVICWKSHANQKRKWFDLGLYSLVYLLPMVIWSARNYVESGQINNRSFQWVPLTTKNIYSLINTIITWYVPENLVNGRERWVFLLIGILFIGLGLIYIMGKRKSFPNSQILQVIKQPLFLLHGIYIFFYILMVIGSKILLDSGIGMTDRMFSPMLVSTIIPGSAVAARLWSGRKTLVRIIIVVFMIYLAAYFTQTALTGVNKFHRQGIGLARKSWHTSEVIQSLPEYTSLPMYSNSPSTLYLWTGESGWSVLALDHLIESGYTGKAILVIFNHIPPNNRINRLEQQLTLLDSDPTAKIYLYEP